MMEILTTWAPWIAVFASAIAIAVSYGFYSESTKYHGYYKGVEQYNYQLERRIISLEESVQSLQKRIDLAVEVEDLTDYLREKDSASNSI